MTEALNSPEREQWKAAAEDEIKSLNDHETWTLAQLPPDRRVVGSKWVFKTKYNSEGEIDRFKCRLVAQGYSQREGMDYTETFAPVAKFATIRSLLALAVERGMHIHQMDVKTAFLNGTLEETIFMKQPEGFIKPGSEELVCQLKKSLYGLKQSPKCWYDALSVYLKELNFQQSVADPCMFYKWERNDLTLLTVYVGDLILMVDVYEKLIKLKEELSSRFKMTDMGKLSYCLGICVVPKERSLQIHQKPYLVKVICRFGMEDASTIGTPSDPHVQLSVAPGTSQPADKHKYLQIVGSLQYAASGTRPDIAFSVNAAGRYCRAPLQLHMTAVKRILRYLSKTSDYGIEYTRSDGKLEGYSDADWAGDHADRRSTSGYVFQLGKPKTEFGCVIYV